MRPIVTTVLTFLCLIVAHPTHAASKPLSRSQQKKFVASVLKYFALEGVPGAAEKQTRILEDLKEYEGRSWKGLRDAFKKNARPFMPPFRKKSGASLRRAPAGLESCTFELGLPGGLSPSRPAPLALLLHGGGRGVGAGSQIMGLLGPAFQKRRCIVVAPTVPPNAVWAEPVSETFVKAILWEICASYPVDFDRIYVAGHSMGGVGAWSFASRFPDWFAGFGAAAGNPPNMMDYDLFHNTPMYVVHGVNDVQVTPDMDQAAQKAVEALSVKPNHYHFDFFTASDARGHGFPNDKIEAMAGFLLDKSRDMFVKRCVCVAPFVQVREGNRERFHSFWLGVDERPYKGKAVGILDGSNTIRISTEGVRSLSLYVSDDFLNLDEQIVVVVDGVKKFEGEVKRSTAFLIDEMRRTGDRGRVFANRIEIK